MRIILASASPRRKQLMSQADISCEIIPASGEEKSGAAEPEKYVEELASHKAAEIFERACQTGDAVTNGDVGDVDSEVCVIGADTIVTIDGDILGKPLNADDAERMIEMLQGRTHEVMTGVCIIYRNKSGVISRRCFCEITKVHVYPMTRQEMTSYASGSEPLDKAGAYAIQGDFAVYIRGIDGDYNNVVGLPIARLYHELKDLGICG